MQSNLWLANVGASKFFRINIINIYKPAPEC